MACGDKTGYPTVFGERSGEVGVKDFDRAILDMLGPEKRVGPKEEPVRFLKVPTAAPEINDEVSVTMVAPEQVLTFDILPVIIVTRESIAPALSRWTPENLQYRVPAQGAQIKTLGDQDLGVCKGWDMLESVPAAFPFDFSYSIGIYSRYRWAADKILRRVIRKIRPYFTLSVLDSLGDLREYQATSSDISDVSELTDVADRVVGFMLSPTVQGELDEYDPEVVKTIQEIDLNMSVIPVKCPTCPAPKAPKLAYPGPNIYVFE